MGQEEHHQGDSGGNRSYYVETGTGRHTDTSHSPDSGGGGKSGNDTFTTAQYGTSADEANPGYYASGG